MARKARSDAALLVAQLASKFDKNVIYLAKRFQMGMYYVVAKIGVY